MIVENHQETASARYDHCVIGSGAMGMALALQLSQAGKSVLLLEAGDEEVTERNQDYCYCEVEGRVHTGSSDGRFRVFGGSTERWGGQAMRFDQADFTKRPSVYGCGWPVDFEELSNYYLKAEQFMGVEHAPYEQFSDDFDNALPHARGRERPSCNAFSDFKIHYSAFTREPRLREVYRKQIVESNRLFLWKNATATALATDGSGKVNTLKVRTGEKDYQIYANHYILAAGGVENARFLLIQRDILGIPELAELGTIGRYFQDHPGAHVAELNGRGAAIIQDLFRLKETPSMNLKGRISWSEEKRLRSGLLAVSGTFLMMRQKSIFDVGSLGARPRIGSIQEWIATAKSAFRGKLYSPLHHTYLAVSAEDMRNPESRITLSGVKKDRLGSPRATVEWKVDKTVAESICAYVDAIDSSLSRQGLGKLRKFPFMADLDQLTAVLSDNAHHIGSTGMGVSSEASVVDSNLRVFGFSNFWITGTSVLPTGSHANPTLTSLAFAFRLAERLASHS